MSRGLGADWCIVQEEYRKDGERREGGGEIY